MKFKQQLSALLLVAYAAISALAQSNPPLRVQSVDKTVNKLGANTLVLSNGSVTCSGAVCTITTSGGGSGTDRLP